MRIVIAAVVGGVIVFVWSAVAHMVTPLGTAGIAMLPDEDQVTDTLRTHVSRSAVYIYPGLDPDEQQVPERQQAWEAKVRRGPSGILVYRAGGKEPAFPRRLGLELLAVILSSLVAAVVLARTTGTWLGRAAVVALFALFAFLSISASHWIWYDFPAAFVGASLVVELTGYLLAGLAMAKIVPPPVP